MKCLGNRANYDRWANLVGDENWSYNGMLKYFKKLEKFEATLVDRDPVYHNFDGPVRIANVPYRTAVAEAFVQAGRELLGLPEVDYNGEKQTGFAYLQANQINGERVSANRAYLHPVRNRRNLFVTMNSHVNKVLINRETKTAYGVDFTKQNRRIKVTARKEVILCAGALSTPKILMLSGIGPAQHLRSLNIKVLVDAAVGENLYDHIAFGGLTFLTNETETVVVPDLLNPKNPAISDYLLDRKGPITLPSGIEAVGYVNVDDVNPNNEEPNIEFVLASITLGTEYFLYKPFGITDQNWRKSFASALWRHGYVIWPLLMQPRSRGRVLLRSADPMTKPKIFPNYFSDPDDVRVNTKGIRMAIELSKTKAMQRFNSQLHHSVVPGCEYHEPDSDDYWECAARTYTVTTWHFCGTAKMGREDDPSAVVNSRALVSILQPFFKSIHDGIKVICIFLHTGQWYQRTKSRRRINNTLHRYRASQHSINYYW